MIAPQRIEWIDVARGASIILVVVYHANVWLDSYHLVSDVYGQIDRVLRPIRMPLFFTIAGILGGGAVKKSWSNVLTRKTGVLLYLYGLWSLIQWLVFYIIPVNSKDIDFGSHYYQLFTMWYEPQSGTWFIWALALYYVTGKMFYFSSRLFIFSVSLLVSIISWGGMITLESEHQMEAIRYAVFFLGGLWYGQIFIRMISIYKSRSLVMCVAIFAISTIATQFRDAELVVGAAKFVRALSGLMLGCIAAMALTRVYFVKTIFIYLGTRTLQIYLTQEIFIEIYSAFASACGIESVAFHYISSPMMVVTAIVSSLAVYRLAISVGATWLFELPSTVLWVAASDDSNKTSRLE